MNHPAHIPDALDLLRTVFGHAAFRGAQAEIVGHVAAGGDALVLMPTGGGKSLCYQLPAYRGWRPINVGSQLTCRNPLGLNEVPRKDLAARMGVNLMQPEPANRDQAGLCELFSTPFQSPRCRSRAIHDCAWRT
jgi:hypothetical protein